MKPPKARVRWLAGARSEALPAALVVDDSARDAVLVVAAAECASPTQSPLPPARELASGTQVFLLATRPAGFVARLLGRAALPASPSARAGLLLARGYRLCGSSGEDDVVWGAAP